MNSEFAKFIASSAVAAALNFGSRILFSQWMHFLPAVTLAFLVGLSSAFILNRTFVFAASGKHWSREAGWFVLINLAGLLQTLVVSWVLASHMLPALGQTSFVQETAHAFGIAAPILVSYFGHKFLTFRGPRNGN